MPWWWGTPSDRHIRIADGFALGMLVGLMMGLGFAAILWWAMGC
jgi:hypothetical protein